MVCPGHIARYSVHRVQLAVLSCETALSKTSKIHTTETITSNKTNITFAKASFVGHEGKIKKFTNPVHTVVYAVRNNIYYKLVTPYDLRDQQNNPKSVIITQDPNTNQNAEQSEVLLLCSCTEYDDCAVSPNTTSDNRRTYHIYRRNKTEHQLKSRKWERETATCKKKDETGLIYNMVVV